MHKFPTKIDQTPGRPTRRLTIFVLTLAVVVGISVSSPSVAEATCGDYLNHQGQATHDAGPFEKLPPGIPCHGPSCGKGPVKAPLSAPVVTLDYQDDWGLVATSSPTDLEQATILVRRDAQFCMPIMAQRLDRPPKI